MVPHSVPADAGPSSGPGDQAIVMKDQASEVLGTPTQGGWRAQTALGCL